MNTLLCLLALVATVSAQYNIQRPQVPGLYQPPKEESESLSEGLTTPRPTRPPPPPPTRPPPPRPTRPPPEPEVHSEHVGLDWLRDSVPGEPEVDYPIYHVAPQTRFSCADRPFGYYADQETRCQAFRICMGDGSSQTYLCPNGTLFRQEAFVCDWWFNVVCDQSENFFFRNEEIGIVPEKSASSQTNQVRIQQTSPIRRTQSGARQQQASVVQNEVQSGFVQGNARVQSSGQQGSFVQGNARLQSSGQQGSFVQGNARVQASGQQGSFVQGNARVQSSGQQGSFVQGSTRGQGAFVQGSRRQQGGFVQTQRVQTTRQQVYVEPQQVSLQFGQRRRF